MKSNNPIINILIVAFAIVGPFTPAYFIFNDNVWAFIISCILNTAFILFVDTSNALFELTNTSLFKKKEENVLGIIERTIEIHREAIENYRSGGVSEVFIIKTGKFKEDEPEFVRAEDSINALDIATPEMLNLFYKNAIEEEDYERAKEIMEAAKKRAIKLNTNH